MPIRFACEHCGQKLNVSSRQAGISAKCPKCQKRIKVPAESSRPTESKAEVDSPAADPATEPAAEDAAMEANPYSEFMVYDDDVEWSFEPEETERERAQNATVDLTRVAIPRSVLYLQGALLIIVACVAFILGFMLGGNGKSKVASIAPRPCVLTGIVVYTAASGANRPDDESVVLVFPTEARPAPQNKIAIDGLRPGDPFPHDDSHNLQLLRSLGGECVRTDEQGQFELQLPDAGQFFVLVVSKNAYRNPGQQFAQGEMNDIAQLGRYVQSATDLLGNSKYEWRQVAVRGDRRLEFAF